MHHVIFNNNQGPYEVAFLIKRAALKERELEKHYLGGLDPSKCIGFSLEYGGKKKPTATIIKDYLGSLLPALDSLSISVLYCADGEYFKKLTKQSKAEPHLGYVLPCAVDGYEHLNVVYGVNYQSLFYNPDNQSKLDLSLKTLKDHMQGQYQAIGENIISHAMYPETHSDIANVLASLHREPVLTCDIEAFSLNFWEAGIGSIGFAWDKHQGVSFLCDYVAQYPEPDPKEGLSPGYQSENREVRKLLREFFETYEGTLIWHNAGYDLKVIVYSLWMDHLLDYEGMLEGIEVMTRKFEDTKLLTYLATNSCAGNKLSLKEQAHEYAGNYAQSDIDNIARIKRSDLLRYNLVDCLSTWFVFEKHSPTVDADGQRSIYTGLFRPAVKQILQMEMVGMPIHMPAVEHAEKELTKIHDTHWNELQDALEQCGFLKFRRMEEVLEYNNTHVRKQKTEDDYKDLRLNPGSPKQVAHLLHEFWDFPILDYTETKQPATGTKTLEKLQNHTTNPTKLKVLNALVELTKVDKILTAFIPKFLGAVPVADSTHRLYGSFNLGGTVSGRLSSSKPNLQQIPSGSTYAKLIKNCFRAPKGFVFGGADFSALEDVVNSLLTKDPAKLAVWEKGFDGHCYRMVRYWPEQFTHIDVNNVDEVNGTKKTHDALRSKSKAPSFAMQFQGTPKTLEKNCGFSHKEAQDIYDNYHKMYAVSAQWTAEKLLEASKRGYVEGAFGLRIRTPLISQVVWNGPKVPHEAKAEGRTAGNAISGQSYGLLNSRAAVEMQERILASPYRTEVQIIALIHDAIYLIWKDRLEVTKWVNDNLIECMEWNDLPELQHPTVKLKADLDIFYPTWGNAITIKYGMSYDEIYSTVHKGIKNG